MLERKRLALALLLLLPAAPAPASSQDRAERDPIVMHVAGDPIPLSAYRNWLVRTRGEPLSRLYTEFWLIRREAERRAG